MRTTTQRFSKPMPRSTISAPLTKLWLLFVLSTRMALTIRYTDSACVGVSMFYVNIHVYGPQLLYSSRKFRQAFLTCTVHTYIVRTHVATYTCTKETSFTQLVPFVNDKEVHTYVYMYVCMHVSQGITFFSTFQFTKQPYCTFAIDSIATPLV